MKIPDIYGHICKNGHGYEGDKYISCPVCLIDNWELLDSKTVNTIRTKPLKMYFQKYYPNNAKEKFDEYCKQYSEKDTIYSGITWDDINLDLQ